jgi:hypothetical protein
MARQVTHLPAATSPFETQDTRLKTQGIKQSSIQYSASSIKSHVIQKTLAKKAKMP